MVLDKQQVAVGEVVTATCDVYNDLVTSNGDGPDLLHWLKKNLFLDEYGGRNYLTINRKHFQCIMVFFMIEWSFVLEIATTKVVSESIRQTGRYEASYDVVESDYSHIKYSLTISSFTEDSTLKK